MNEVKYYANFYKFSKSNLITPIYHEVEIEQKDIFKVCIPQNADVVTLCEKQKLTDYAYSKPLNVEFYCIGSQLSAQEAQIKFGEFSQEEKFIIENNLQNIILLKDGTFSPLMSKLGATCINVNSIDEKGFLINNCDKNYLWLE